VTTGKLANIKQIIAVHSAKGGVGKSTVAVNLAVGLAQRGARVGLMDADVHGPSGSIMMGTSEWPDPGHEPNTIKPIKAHGIQFMSMGNLVNRETPLIWRGAMVHSVVNQFLGNVVWGDLDYLIIDMPPGTGDAQLTISQGVPLTGAVVVSTPQELSLADTMRGISVFEQVQVPILGMVENMSYFVCDGCEDRAELFGHSEAETLCEELGFPLLGRLPLEPNICSSGDSGKPLMVSHKNSASARVMDSILDNLLVILEKRRPTNEFNIEWREMEWNERYPDPPKEEQAPDAPVKSVWQVSGDELGICWPDGSVSTFSARELRLACPCAVCVDEWTGDALLDPNKVSTDITFKKITSVGRYALNPTFSDGHSSGLFHFGRIQGMAEKKAQV